MPVAALNALDRVLVIGSFLRNDHPLVAQRLRQAAKKRARIMKLHAVDDDWLMPVAHKTIVPPSVMPAALADIVVAAARLAGKAPPATLTGASREPSDAAKAIAAELAGGERRAILLGTFAEQHPQASQLHALAQALADTTGATLGFLREAANSVGGDLAEARPIAGGLDAGAMLAEPRKAYILVHAEAEFDFANPVATRRALDAADLVVALTAFRHGTEYADVLLPIAPFTETSGTFVNCEGRPQSFRGTVQPPGETRPGWKVLRVLGTMLGIPGFEIETSEAVRDAVLPPGADIAGRLDNRSDVAIGAPSPNATSLERAADVPIYFADPLVRRAPSLQKTRLARPPAARMHPEALASLGIDDGAPVRVRQGSTVATVAAEADPTVPPGVVRLASAHAATSPLDGATGPVSVERA
jgi:NADH-quinone oxidoreductase subunit G